jgi:hypothetical protein
MASEQDDRKDLARLHKEVDRMRAAVERAAPAELRRREEAPRPEPGELGERRSQRPRTDPTAWPTYRRAESRPQPKPKRRVSDAFGWTLVGLALIVLIVVIIVAAYVLHSLLTAVVLAIA